MGDYLITMPDVGEARQSGNSVVAAAEEVTLSPM